jgi:hypothetical protein
MASKDGEFCIFEIPPGGQPGEGEVFVWSSSATAPRSDLGGARAAPIGGWKMGAHLRSVRTDYPGAVVPSKQILGAVHKPFTWTGIWWDKFNFPGYAQKEHHRFEKVCFRGNVIKVSYGEEEFFAFIDDVDVEVVRDWERHYTLTVDVQCRTDNSSIDRSFSNAANPADELDGLNTDMAKLADTHAVRPSGALTGTNTSGVSEGLAQASAYLDGVAKALDTKTGVLSPIGYFRSLATQMRVIEGNYSSILAGLIEARSDLDVGGRNARDVLRFEDWSRNTSTMLRMSRGRAHKAANNLDSRDTGATFTVYRPRKGESLYSISRKKYGTPFRTQQIIISNNLKTTLFTGNETLILPNVVAA